MSEPEKTFCLDCNGEISDFPETKEQFFYHGNDLLSTFVDVFSCKNCDFSFAPGNSELKRDFAVVLFKLKQALKNSQTDSLPTSFNLQWIGTIMAVFFEKINAQQLRWIVPHISVDSNDNAVVFEWWNNEKTLSLYFNNTGDIEYINSIGTSVTHDMKDGIIETEDEFCELWKWFLD